MAKKRDLSEGELSQLVEEVLKRLARDRSASHLWHWLPRPGCADEPAGRSRRSHLSALLGLLGAAALPGIACKDDEPPDCGDDPCGCADDPCACADDPC